MFLSKRKIFFKQRASKSIILSRYTITKKLLPYLKKFSSLYGLNKKQERSEVDAICNKTTVKHSGIDLEVQFLSGGNQQKILFARAAMGKPKLLIADEPTGNLDSLMARQVMELLNDLNKEGATIIMVTHDPDQARAVQRNVQIIDGQVSDFGIYEPMAATNQEAVQG